MASDHRAFARDTCPVRCDVRFVPNADIQPDCDRDEAFETVPGFWLEAIAIGVGSRDHRFLRAAPYQSPGCSLDYESQAGEVINA
jgi:hypothetical protein